MYGLPKSIDLTFFVGRELEQICFNANQVSFSFDQGVALCVESAFRIREPGTLSVGRQLVVPVLQTDIMHLIGQRVMKAETNDGSTLELLFENATILDILDTSDCFESYHIIRDGMQTITV